MNNQVGLNLEAIELEQLLKEAGDDPILEPQLRDRLAEIKKKISLLTPAGELFPDEPFVLPRAAIFLYGGDVSEFGIRPALAGEALIQYERMYTEQAMHDEREAAKKVGRFRRPRGASTPGLLFTGTPRGSFGFEFVPLPSADEKLLEVHARSLTNVADALLKIASDEATTEANLRQIPPRLLQPLKQFFKVLSQHHAELRLAFHDRPARDLSYSQLQRASELLEREVSQEVVTIEGMFRGVTRESGVFDFKQPDGDVITGTVADNLTEEDLDIIDRLTNHKSKAVIQQTTISKVGSPPYISYVLIEAIDSSKRLDDRR